jgi:hypothetical protein
MWIWPPILIGVIALYMGTYVLLRTSGDGRPAIQRLLHPGKGGLQEEYGGDGTGHLHSGLGHETASSGSPVTDPNETSPCFDNDVKMHAAIIGEQH